MDRIPKRGEETPSVLCSACLIVSPCVVDHSVDHPHFSSVLHGSAHIFKFWRVARQPLSLAHRLLVGYPLPGPLPVIWSIIYILKKSIKKKSIKKKKSPKHLKQSIKLLGPRKQQ